MAIARIKVSNFKSFKDLDVQLGRFNVMIGANASGKSNFIQIFKFLKDIADFGLDNAISMQGGPKYLTNLSIGTSQDLTVEVVTDRDSRLRLEKPDINLGLKLYRDTYRFALNFPEKGTSFEISYDSAIVACAFYRLEARRGKWQEKESLGEGTFTISTSKGRLQLQLSIPSAIPLREEDLFPSFLKERAVQPKALLAESPIFFMFPTEEVFRTIAIYDFDPKLPKKAAQITGKAQLDEDGGNLALVLKKLTENKTSKRKLSNLI